MQCTLAALFYGDYPQLARRCLGSWGLLLGPSSGLSTVAICVNEISESTRNYLQDWLRQQRERGWTGDCFWLEGDRNVGKYPMLRALLRSSATESADHLMWFDDDAYLDFPLEIWWPRLSAVLLAQAADLVGQLFYMRMTPGQWRWIKEQSWSNPEITQPLYRYGQPMFRFCQGSWWVAKLERLREVDFPPLELHHCGGDTLLGEIARQRGWKVLDWHWGVRLNAGPQGENSKSPRRGINQPRLAANYQGQPLSTDHYRDCRIRCEKNPVG